MPEGLSSQARKGANLEMFMKLTAIVIAIVLTFVGRGMENPAPPIIMIVLIFPLWMLAEKVMANTESSSLWKSIEEKEDFSRLPLMDDINKMKGAREGQKVKQAILEGRLKDQVYYTLKNEYNLSDEEIKNLDKDIENIPQRIDNEKLIEYLKHARDLNDLKKPDGDDQLELFSEETNGDSDGEKVKFEDKIKSAVAELEKIHYIEEDR